MNFKVEHCTYLWAKLGMSKLQITAMDTTCLIDLWFLLHHRCGFTHPPPPRGIDILIFQFKVFLQVKRLFRNATLHEIYGIRSFMEPIRTHNEYGLGELSTFPVTAPDEAFYDWVYGVNLTRKGHPYRHPIEHKFKFSFPSHKPGVIPNPYGLHWTWPFIDCIYYDEDDEKVWKMHKDALIFPKASFYPLQQRPFGNLWLPCPKDTELWLKYEYRRFACRSHSWNHVTGHGRSPRGVSCFRLLHVYPFVWHTYTPGCQIETLMINRTVLRTLTLSSQNNQTVSFGIETYRRNK